MVLFEGEMRVLWGTYFLMGIRELKNLAFFKDSKLANQFNVFYIFIQTI